MNSLLSPITALTQSPAIDAVGVGFMSREISVYDIRADGLLMKMHMDIGSQSFIFPEWYVAIDFSKLSSHLAAYQMVTRSWRLPRQLDTY
jgi:hypothetical protein